MLENESLRLLETEIDIWLIFEQMDRTAILADAIEYMKELLEKIGNLQREVDGSNPRTNSLNNTKPSELVARNSPKVIQLFLAFPSFDTITRLLLLPKLISSKSWAYSLRWKAEWGRRGSRFAVRQNQD